MALSDAIQATNALFKKVWVKWQIKQYQMTRKLEVSTFTANF